ncbi:ABC transporter substrate-binding protein [uncultured Limnohabitans sp.]|jgi:polar amino acid transport system substrate-binding protein|uniref:ABC transporter substrate-binding protein n=1 Tax=uncultured Limnohabitans sp. TaxID=768543 RepID=UPI00261D5705|nr:ABC transporter substrate-binding protein [uncultured Limnohabitans sp.]
MNTPSAPSLASLVAPHGPLRVAINLGNPVLAGLDAAGEPSGISADLSRLLAAQLGIGIEWCIFKKADESVQCVRADEADVGFFAIDPVRGEGLHFSPPYVQIEGAYMVRNDSPLQSNDKVDHASHRVTVGAGSAYDLFLTRHLKHAPIVRAPSSPAVVDVFMTQQLEVAAGVKQQLQADAQRLGGVRLLPGRFMVIHQAMGMPAQRSEQARQCLNAFVEEAKRSGWVADAFVRHQIQGAAVAPPGYPAHD